MNELTLQIVVGAIALQGFGFGSAAIGYLLIRDEGLDFIYFSRPSLHDLGWSVGGLFALFSVLIISNVIQITFGVESASHSLVESGITNPEILLVLVPLSIILVGPSEELLFRGVIQQLLRLQFGIAIGIGIASVIFALVHIGSLTGEGLVPTLLTYIALSTILGISYEYSRTLTVPALIHGVFNAFQFGLLYWVATTDTPTAAMLLLII